MKFNGSIAVRFLRLISLPAKLMTNLAGNFSRIFPSFKRHDRAKSAELVRIPYPVSRG
jgi:hypothetical protein